MATLPEQMVSQPSQLQECIEHLQTVEEIAFDTEFVGEDRYRPDLCLIQLATRQRLFLIDPLTLEKLDAFWQELLHPRHTLIVHAGREEVRICHFNGNAVPSKFFDLQIVAALTGYSYPIGYGTMLQQVLNVRLPKGETLTDWRRRPLSEEQVHYAYDDVRYLLPVWDRLKTVLIELDRLSWAIEESSQFITRSMIESIQAERWRKLPGLTHFDRRKLAIVRELYRWREEKAAVLNRPARFVLRDDLIAEIAKRNPHKEKDFSTLRGLGKIDTNSILAAIERARNLSPAECPLAPERDNDAAQIAMIATLLGAILTDWCGKQNLSASFTATASDLRTLVRARATGEAYPEDAALNRGWRREKLLPELLAFLEGRKSIRVDNLNSSSPFRFEETSSEK